MPRNGGTAVVHRVALADVPDDQRPDADAFVDQADQYLDLDEDGTDFAESSDDAEFKFEGGPLLDHDIRATSSAPFWKMHRN